jgi:Tfp pilus assembly protein FimT
MALRPHPARTRRRAAYTVIELAITLGIAALLAAMALPAVDFNRFRMDADARMVQNWLLNAQSRAVQRNMQVLLEIFYERNQIRIIDDSTGDGNWTSGETRRYFTLADGMKFVTPPSTIDGATAYYATGAGVSLNGAQSHPQIKFYPNGSLSGAAIIYLGSPKGRLQDNRAIKMTAATAKMSFYRMGANGVWSLSEL